MAEDDFEEMESDLANDRVWSDALASYEMIRRGPRDRGRPVGACRNNLNLLRGALPVVIFIYNFQGRLPCTRPICGKSEAP